MERLKNMGLKKSFLLLSLSCLAVAFLLLGAVIFLCRGIENHYPLGGVEILSDGSVVPLPSPTVSQQRILATLNIVQTVSCILFPAVSYTHLDVYKRQGLSALRTERLWSKEVAGYDMAF